MAFHYQRVCMTKEENYRKEAMNLEVQKTFMTYIKKNRWNQNGLVMVFSPNSVNFGVSAQIKFQCGFGASSGETAEILGFRVYPLVN